MSSLFPRASFTWSTTVNLSYVVISWVGNATVNWASGSSGNIYSPTTTYTTGDLSFNTLYTFALTPYNNKNTSGAANILKIDTTPLLSGIYASYYTSSAAKLHWYGTYDYVKVSRAIGTLGFVDISTTVIGNEFYDYDLSGNTKYKYYITPYKDGVASTASDTITINTNVQAPKDVSINFVDTSGIIMSFTQPKNTFSNRTYYTAYAVDVCNNMYSTTGFSSPLVIYNLSGETQYTCYVRATLDYSSNLVGTSSSLTQTTKTGNYTNISFFGGNTYVVGSNRIFVFNANPVSVYSPTSNASNPTGIMSVDTNTNTTATILAVGGGGGGGGGAPGRPCGGGGAGGLIYTTKTINSTNIIYASVGRGGGSTSRGTSSLLYFTQGIAGGSIDASGGGYGNWAIGASRGGSGGGNEGTVAYDGYYGLGNKGGTGVDSTSAGGGGGAGGVGGNGTYNSSILTAYGGNGGDGLPYDITGTMVYYAAGGGGAANATNHAGGKGGNGGGGDGVSGYFSGDGKNATGYGCGGGGAVQAYSGGKGSDGIIVVSIPLKSISTLYYFVDDMSGMTFWYNFNTSLTYESLTKSTSGTTTGTIAQSSITPFTTTGYSASFTGSNAYITLSNTINLSQVGFSLCAWFKIPAATLSAGFNLIQVGGSSFYFQLCVYSGNSNYLGFYSKSNTTVMANVYYPMNIFDDTWHHSALIMKNNGSISWYIDGQMISYTTVVTTTYPSITSYNTQYIGDSKSVSNTGTYYLDDVRYYNGPITSNTVTELYSQNTSKAQLTTYSASTYETSSIKISWGGSNVSKVFVYDLVSNKVGGAFDNSFVIWNGLTSNTTYNFVVSPFDIKGVQGASVIVSATTPIKPVIWYKFNSSDINGLTLYNYGSNSYDTAITSTNIISTSQVKYNSGSLYITSTYTLTGPSMIMPPSNGSFSIACWFKWGTAAFFDFMSFYSSTLSSSYFDVRAAMLSTGNNTDYFRLVDAQGNNFDANGFNDGQWHHCVYVVTSVDGGGINNGSANVTFYKDGTLYGGPYAKTYYTVTTRQLVINGGNFGSSSFYINDYRYYELALTAAQVSGIYNGTY